MSYISYLPKKPTKKLSMRLKREEMDKVLDKELLRAGYIDGGYIDGGISGHRFPRHPSDSKKPSHKLIGLARKVGGARKKSLTKVLEEELREEMRHDLREEMRHDLLEHEMGGAHKLKKHKKEKRVKREHIGDEIPKKRKLTAWNKFVKENYHLVVKVEPKMRLKVLAEMARKERIIE